MIEINLIYLYFLPSLHLLSPTLLSILCSSTKSSCGVIIGFWFDGGLCDAGSTICNITSLTYCLWDSVSFNIWINFGKYSETSDYTVVVVLVVEYMVYILI